MPRRVKNIYPVYIDKEWADRAQTMKEQAAEMPNGPERDALLKRVRQLETASNIKKWVESSGLSVPE